MGSPFDKFRKHQKRLLVFLGVVCMVAFVFAGVQCSGPGMATTRPYLSIEGEVLTQADLKKWLDDRRLAGRVANIIREKTGRRFGFGTATEEEIITLMLLVRLGEELGIRVSDAQINQFLSEYSDGKVSAQEIREVLKEFSATEADLFRALRRELIAAQVMLIYVPPGNTTLPSGALALQVDQLAGGLSRTSPSMLWDVFLKQNRLADIEAIPFHVEESLGAVGTPDEQTLREFFEKYKDQLPDPNSPTPGFRQPHRVKLRWIRIPYQKIFDQALAEVTDEEIRQYYEENKENFPYTGLETEPPSAHLPLVAPEPQTSASSSQEETSSGNAKPPAEEEPAQKPAGQNTRKQSQRRLPSAAGLVQRAASVVAGPLGMLAMQQTEQGQTATSSAQAAEQPDQQADAVPAERAADKSDAGSATKQSEDEQSLSLTASELQVPDDIRTGPRPRYDPLWKVEDRIRRLLAQKKANQRIAEIARQVLAPLIRFSQRWTRWDASGRKGPEPQLPDLSDLLQRFQLQLEATPLVDARELMEKYPLGKAYLGQMHPQFGWQATQPVLMLVFEHLGLYQVEQARDAENNHYIFWKEEDRPSYVPTLDEVREEVVRAWRIEKARTIAEEGAKAILKVVRQAESPDLQKEAEVTGKPYIHPQPFSWWDPSPQGFFEVSQVPELDNVGEEFMKTVFSLEPGETTVASNRPQTVYYLVRLVGFEYRGGQTEEQARRTFRAQMGLVMSTAPFAFQLRRPYLFATQQEYVQSAQAWQSFLYRRYDVQRLEAASQ